MSQKCQEEECATNTCTRPTMSAKEAARLLPMAPSTVYKACNSGAIDAVKIGGRWVILRRPLEKKLQIGHTCTCCK